MIWILTALITLLSPHVAWADNCGGLHDCFNTVYAALAALAGVSLFGTMVSLGLNLFPLTAIPKGIAEAITGTDLITGTELALWERAVGVVPVAGEIVKEGAAVVRGMEAVSAVARGVDELADIERGAEAAADIARVGEGAANVVREAEAVVEGGEAASVGQKVISEESAIGKISNEQFASDLEKVGFSNEYIDQVLKGCEQGTIEKKIAGEEGASFHRWWGGEAAENGRWGFGGEYLDSAEARNIFSIPNENTMENMSNFRIKPGQTYYDSVSTPLFGHGGKGVQRFIIDHIKGMEKLK